MGVAKSGKPLKVDVAGIDQAFVSDPSTGSSRRFFAEALTTDVHDRRSTG
jgi:hypothetical protein